MSHTILINGTTLPIIIRKHPKSRRMVIRYQPLQHHVSLTLPRYVSIKQGLHFVEEKHDWLAEQLNEKISHMPFADGQIIPLMGRNFTLRHIGGRGLVRIEDDCIIVPGDESFMKRRVTEWVKQQARAEITKFAHEKAALIGKRIKKISLRDTSSRWGSCSHEGNLSFSWRLIFAPHEVLEYVVSHEVAHIKHLDHSPAFWSVVATLCPTYRNYRDWLKTHGQHLYAYGG